MRKLLGRLPANVLLGFWTLIIAVPMYLLIISCFKTTQEIYADPLALPGSWSFDNFAGAWVQANFGVYTLNSVIVTTGSVLLTIILAALASYPLSRFRGWWVTPALGFFLLGLMVPVRLGSVELFLLMKDLDLLDSRIGLILVYAAIRLPFAVFIMSSFMRAVPVEFEEAARIDGAGDFRLLLGVLLPQIKPAIGIVAIFTAIAVWNDFYFPLLFIFSEELRTLPLGLANFVGAYRTDWGLLFAGLTISIIPLTLLYLAMSRQVREGVGAGGLK
jgi:raffinose/stachyose/melibiose transport system permease protein